MRPCLAYYSDWNDLDTKFVFGAKFLIHVAPHGCNISLALLLGLLQADERSDRMHFSY